MRRFLEYVKANKPELLPGSQQPNVIEVWRTKMESLIGQDAVLLFVTKGAVSESHHVTITGCAKRFVKLKRKIYDPDGVFRGYLDFTVNFNSLISGSNKIETFEEDM